MAILFVAAIAGSTVACNQSTSGPASGGQGTKSAMSGAAASGSEWISYTNTRFGYLIRVPPGFVSEKAPQNKDGRVFRDKNAALRIFGRHNVLDTNFADQIAQTREDMSDVAVTFRSATMWRAKAHTSDGWMVHVLLIRAPPDDLIVARFSYPGRKEEAFGDAAQRALDSVRLTGAAGPVAYRYRPDRLTAVRTTISLPPDHDRALPATKLVPVERAARIGKPGCSYGLSGQAETCSADREAGLAFALVSRPIANLRNSFDAQRIEASQLAGRPGFRITQSAEGEGATYSFIPAGKDTVVVERLWRSNSDCTACRAVLKNLTVTPDA
ncbi:hypothetical protein KY084_04460 [Stakelama sp. CBK3Z-3]|uniref:Lipoprotein n=1 Tax=Stakelama flava TaxID=2860338 RepID=A0ABS6XJ08_9SPHN|nr:hypothetical protein [Stakelama flava]MBW4330126.1 hypothetical protein [Stakelama flava]